MSTKAQGEKMNEIFLRYHSERKVEDDKEVREILRSLVMGGLIEYTLKDGALHAKASRTGELI
jgi:hypothetical protein